MMLKMEVPKQRVLVCGGRDFGSIPKDIFPDHPDYHEFLMKAESERMLLAETLNRLKEVVSIDAIIEGGARGADTLAGNWADDNHVIRLTYPADWKKHGKAAGFIRNQQMLDEANPSIVIAFPGGNGTKDMVERAKKAELPVYEVSYEVVEET